MCGIAGIVGNEVDPSPINGMADALRHRGPDDSGLWCDRYCVFGHRRLSIIDLSEAGRQPLSNEDGTVWIVFNGEIYNFQELREQLEGFGHKFRTHTDTEVIVHGYEQWGRDCVQHLRGMFAFAIWDQRQHRLFLARDRVGKKPLYYTQCGGEFLFASELQGLLAHPRVERNFDTDTIEAYLTWGYVPAPYTAFRGIKKLAPAHWLSVDVTPEGLRLETQRYWQLQYGPKLTLSINEAAEALREKLTEAVRLRLISDVPLGAFLSGGIDSSIVVGLMAQLSSRPVKTFSIGFGEEDFDELPHARRIAEKWGTDHAEFIVKSDALSILPTLVQHFGEPYADSSAVPTFYVARLTRASVTVALNGDGGDESFAGYERYLAMQLANSWQRIAGSKRLMSSVGSLLPDSIDPKNRVRRLKRFLSVASLPPGPRYRRWVSIVSDDVQTSLLEPEVLRQSPGDLLGSWMEQRLAQLPDPVDGAMAADVESYLPFDLLTKVDITSMANSLEARSPFLDHEVMEFAARLPSNFKLRTGESKYLLKKAFADLLPPENVQRRKMGFGVPVGRWFRTSLHSLMCDTLLSNRALQRGLVQPKKMRKFVDDHVEGRADHGMALWAFLMLELWQEQVLESRTPMAQVSNA
jgi:asparagine synthase (glutamine-hydrolysing)